ncbi:MAG: hypothetical protein H7A22_05700 [Spirochaetales bacterium]|nr:hypothetical protein [Spirochaetales bacterium]
MRRTISDNNWDSGKYRLFGLIVFLSAWSSLAAQSPAVLLLPPLAPDVDQETARLVEESLGNVLQQRGHRVVRLSDLDEDQAARAVAANCGDACHAEVLLAARCEWLVRPRLSRSGSGYMVRMQFLERAGGRLEPVEENTTPIEVWLPNEGPGTIQGRLARALREHPVVQNTADTQQSTPTRDVAVQGSDGDYLIAVQGSAAVLRIRPDPPDSEVQVRTTEDENGVRTVHVVVRREFYKPVELHLRPGGSGEQTIEVVLESTGAGEPDEQLVGDCTRLGALWRSAILPGWGQYCKGQSLRAGLFFSGFLVTGYNYVSSALEYRKALQGLRTESRENALFLALLAYQTTFTFNSAYRYFSTDLLLQFDKNYVEGKLDRFDCYASSCGRARRLRNDLEQAPYFFGIVYVWNLLDAYFAGGAVAPGAGDAATGTDSATYDFSLAPETAGGQRAGFSVRWTF